MLSCVSKTTRVAMDATLTTECIATPEAACRDSLHQWQQLAAATLVAVVLIALCAVWLYRERVVRYASSQEAPQTNPSPNPNSSPNP